MKYAGYIIFFILLFNSLISKERTIGVFVALADNESQGIVKVPKEIGNGEDPEKNLYWGTADGLKSVFDKSKDWKLSESKETPIDNDILRTRVYKNETKEAVLYAKAYKGSSIKKCIQDFELALQQGTYDLVVYIGHNGLMDFELPIPTRLDHQSNKSECVILCCKSNQYFKSRIVESGGKPLLLTNQFMYPGAFILYAVTDSWLSGKTQNEIRERAGAAYAANQKISLKAAIGIFSK